MSVLFGQIDFSSNHLSNKVDLDSFILESCLTLMHFHVFYQVIFHLLFHLEQNRLYLADPGNDRGGASDSISQWNQILFPLFSVHPT